MVARTSKAPTSYWEHFSQPREGGFPPVCRNGDTDSHHCAAKAIAIYLLFGLLNTFHNEKQNENFSAKLQDKDRDMHVK